MLSYRRKIGRLLAWSGDVVLATRSGMAEIQRDKDAPALKKRSPLICPHMFQGLASHILCRQLVSLDHTKLLRIAMCLF